MLTFANVQAFLARLLVEVMAADLMRRNCRDHAQFTISAFPDRGSRSRTAKPERKRNENIADVRVPWVCGRWRRCDAAAWRMPARPRRLRCSRQATSCPRAVRPRRCPRARRTRYGQTCWRCTLGLVKVSSRTEREPAASAEIPWRIPLATAVARTCSVNARLLTAAHSHRLFPPRWRRRRQRRRRRWRWW